MWTFFLCRMSAISSLLLHFLCRTSASCIYTKTGQCFIHVQNLMLLIINCMHTDTGRLMYCGWCYLIWKSSKELGSEDNFDVIKTENLFSLTVAYPDFLLLNLFVSIYQIPQRSIYYSSTGKLSIIGAILVYLNSLFNQFVIPDKS